MVSFSAGSIDNSYWNPDEIEAKLSEATDRAIMFESMLPVLLPSCVFLSIEHQKAVIAAAIPNKTLSSVVACARQCLESLLSYILKTNIEHRFKITLLEEISCFLDFKETYFSFEIVLIREILAMLFSNVKEYAQAVRVLLAIPIDGSHGVTINDERKYNICVATAEALLACGDTVTAESYYTRAGFCLPKDPDPSVYLRFRLAQAFIFDSRLRLVEAAHKYYELSRPKKIIEAIPSPPNKTIHEQNLLSNGIYQMSNSQISSPEMLRASAICAILAPVSVSRERILTVLVEDERKNILDADLVFILNKASRYHFLRASDEDKFKSFVRGHHESSIIDGLPLLQYSMIEHNILCASRIYLNITFESLAEIIGIFPEKACSIVAKMICEDRLLAKIDHVHSHITFSQESNGTDSWSTRISDFCTSVDKLASKATLQQKINLNPEK